MTSIRQIIIVISGLLLTTFSFGQITPRGLRSDKIQRQIIDNTLTCDSLILFDRSSFWSDDKSVKGFVFKKGKCYKTSLTFMKVSEFGIELNKIDIEKEIVFEDLNKYVTLNFSSLKNLNNDSLNIKSRTNTFMTMSDQDEFTILIVFPKTNLSFYKNSYNPEAYQQKAWTADRQILLDAFARLKSHIN